MSETLVRAGSDATAEVAIRLVQPLLPDHTRLAAGIEDILSSGMVTKGKYLREFEEAVAAHLGVDHAVAVSSCTTGLMLTYRCLGLVGEVVVPSFTFMATVSALVWAGARPVFADVEYDTATVDPASVEAAITPETTAIVGVHTFGNPAHIEALRDIAARHKLRLVFDAAHGFGSLYDGAPLGAIGDANVFSLSPTKLLIAGEGGIVATNDAELAERIRIGREYGNAGDYDSAFAGFNARMSELNALLGLHSLEQLEGAARRRTEVAALFRRELSTLPGLGFQSVRPQDRCSYKDFSITVDADLFGLTRDNLAAALARRGIDTRAYYDPPVHRHTAYRAYAADASLPETDCLAARSLSLPIWSQMTDDTALAICDAVRAAHGNA